MIPSRRAAEEMLEVHGGERIETMWGELVEAGYTGGTGASDGGSGSTWANAGENQRFPC